MKKRHSIAILFSFVVVIAAMVGCGSDNDTPSPVVPDDHNGKTKSYLFVQNASSGTFLPDGNGNYTLTLKGISSQTVYFSDRPVRDAGQISTGAFVEGSCFSTQNPPNAAIDVMDGDESSDLVIAELLNPVYDAEAKTLQYTVHIIKDHNLSVDSFSKRRDDSLPESFGAVAVFIDDCPDLTISCANSAHNSPGKVVCCSCWSWDVVDCDFTKDCCSFERCQNNCKHMYGKDYSYIQACDGSWVNSYEDWENAIDNCVGPQPLYPTQAQN